METPTPSVKITKATCWGLGGCDAGGCGWELHTSQGKLIKVEGDEDCPDNQGRLCPRALGALQYVNHPHRLKYPMKRVGRRGEGKWETISWDEAYDIIVKKLTQIKKEYGPESVIFCQGTGRDIQAWISRLAYSYGSPNWNQATLGGQSCYIPRIAAAVLSFGDYPEGDFGQLSPQRFDNPEFTPPKYALVWGKNPVYSHSDGFHGYWFVDCMKRGTRIISVDPRLTWISARADVWLQLRPGTDAALALGMLNVIINEELYDRTFVEKWCHGFEQLKERVQEYSPEKASNITWVPAEKIELAARLFATNKPSSVLTGVGVDQHTASVQGAMAIHDLMAVTGNIEVPGGNVMVRPPFGVYQMWTGGWDYQELLSPEQRSKRLGLQQYPLLEYGGFLFGQNEVAFGETIFTGKPYSIKGLWIQTTNFLACQGFDPYKHHEALNKVDFIVGVDTFMTPTMQFADVLLPAAATVEKDSINAIWDRISPVVKVVDPPGECKSDPQICLELGKRLNPAAWPWNTVEEMLDAIVKPAGVTFEELKRKVYIYPPHEYHRHENGLLRPDAKPGFNTPTRKLELYVTAFEKFGYDPLPYHIEPPESPISTPEVYKEYPWVLTSGARIPVFTHSEYRQVPWLRECNPDPIVEIHPDTANQLDIANGQWVYIESRRGRCKQRARHTRGIDPRVVHAQHGWWFPEKSPVAPTLFGVWESNVNITQPTLGLCGPQGFGASYRSSLCRVYGA